MPKLPVLSGEELIKALEKAGFKKVRQKGSHISMQKHDKRLLFLCTMN
jgi:predicted RNA binding protein YcfA (HicA-like mRNA interferase family)